ncbi:MAG: YbaK/EbsC family protein [Halioglobus sp.]|nr:YbaK/EbsC family protein [Halioglobus sp.]
MTVAKRQANYLRLTNTHYRVQAHSPSQSAADSAHAAHVPESCVVKGVLLKNRRNGKYLMALAPASNRLNLGWLRPHTGMELEIAAEEELQRMFPDCDTGAVPGFGQAYNVDMIWDEHLADPDQLYLEAGDHRELIEIDHDDFLQLFGTYPHACISEPRGG